MTENFKPRLALLLLIAWVVLTYPFTFLGYGSDGDAWSVAHTADTLWNTGEYYRSRSIGFPLLEIFSAPLVHYGQWYLSNLISLIFGAMTIVSLVFLWKKHKLKNPILVILSICFIPVFIKNSSSTMDYIPALALIMWAYYFCVTRRFLLAAALIGVAVGFRPTSGIFVIPCMAYYYIKCRSWKAISFFFFIAFSIGLLAYSPVIFRHGLLLPPYYSIHLTLFWWLIIGGYFALILFGIPQSLMLLLGTLYFIRQRFKINDLNYFKDPLFIFHLTSIFIWSLLYFVDPSEPEYLLPVVPFVIFIVDQLWAPKAFAVITILLISYHHISVDAVGGESGHRHFELSVKPGFTMRDVDARIFKLSTREAATNYKTNEKKLLMFGYPWVSAANPEWIRDRRYNLYRQKHGKLYISGRMRRIKKLKYLQQEGFKMYVWRGRKWEFMRTDVKGKPWQDYIEVVDHLDDFFGVPIRGKSLSDSE